MIKQFQKIIGACGIAFITMSPFSIKAEDVEVFAAASLTDALKEIAADYEKSSGDKIVFNFAASNTLDMQIKAGAPADLFFSADTAKMDDLDKQSLSAKGSRKDFLANTLDIVVPSDSALTLTSAAQLADAKFAKIALGQPQSVPAGIYAKEYLQKIGIWEKVSARVIPCESVRAALAAVESGNVDAGIVYKTDALHSTKVKVAWEVPLEEGPDISYPVVLLSSSRHAAAAKKFLDYLAEPGSLKVFEKYGFITKG